MRDQLDLTLSTNKIKLLQLKYTKKSKVNEAPVTEIFTLSNKKLIFVVFRFMFQVCQGTRCIYYLFPNKCKSQYI